VVEREGGPFDRRLRALPLPLALLFVVVLDMARVKIKIDRQRVTPNLGFSGRFKFEEIPIET